MTIRGLAVHIFDVFEAWLFSMGKILGTSGITARFERTPLDRPKTACILNLRYRDHEIDLIIWESGEAELMEGSVHGPFNQVHFDDVRNQADLGALLSKLVEFYESCRLN